MTVQHDEPATKQDLDELKQELIAKIGENGLDIRANAEKIEANAEKIEANGKKIDANGKKIDANGVKIEANGKKIDANSVKIDRLIRRTLKNGERLDKMLTEERFKVYFGELMSNTDGLARSVPRGDQERTAMNARLGRVEEDVDKNKTDIKKIGSLSF